MNKGDKITFGQYPQGEHGEVLPLEWRVLDVQGDKALLLTDKLIDYQRYHERFASVTWQTCMLRQWLNGEFINKAFSHEQQDKIALVTNQNPNNPIFGTKGGNPTQDKVFALSIDEVKKYFSSEQSMTAYLTDFAYQKPWANEDKTGWWWLRSPGNDNYSVAIVFHSGGVGYPGMHKTMRHVAVRPALWLNL